MDIITINILKEFYCEYSKKAMTSYNNVFQLRSATPTLVCPKIFGEAESGRQSCEAKWRSHPALTRLKPLGFGIQKRYMQPERLETRKEKNKMTKRRVSYRRFWFGVKNI